MPQKWKVRLTLATLMLAGFFALLGLLAFREIPTTNRDVYNILLGALAGSVGTIMSFYFGDSEGREGSGNE